MISASPVSEAAVPQRGQAGLNHVRPVHYLVLEWAGPVPQVDQLVGGKLGQPGEQCLGAGVGAQERKRLADYPRRVWLVAAQHCLKHPVD